MAIAPTLEKYLAARPTTKREIDVVAFKLFCLFSIILVGLIMAGILYEGRREAGKLNCRALTKITVKKTRQEMSADLACLQYNAILKLGTGAYGLGGCVAGTRAASWPSRHSTLSALRGG